MDRRQFFFPYRDENPVGEWTIRVSDQQQEGRTGSFLGWSMTLWGSTIDPSQAKQYEVPIVQNLLPPEAHEDDHPVILSSTAVAATSTKTRPKPTAHLPGDHGDAEGDSSTPAFTNGAEDAAEATASSSMTPTPDEGWFSDMSSLASNQKWFVGAVALVLVFAAAVGVFFWRRRAAQRRRAQYSSVAGDDLAMSSVGRGVRSDAGGPRNTKELYDAFGEVSDDDEDADEETGLRGGRPQDRSPAGLGFHSGFLDDEEPPSAPLYRDEPSAVERAREHGADERADSPASGSGIGSADGSWEHASQIR
jgi:kexin